MGESFWQKILASFNPKSYKETISQSLGQSFRYLALFFLLLALVISIKGSIDFYRALEDLAGAAPAIFEKLQDFPEIKIEKGKVVSPKEKFSGQWEDFSFIIDIEGEVQSYLEGDEEMALILLEDEIIWKTPEKTEIRGLSKINYFSLKLGQPEAPIVEFDGKTFELTVERLKFWANRASLLFFPFLFIFTFFSLFIGKSIQVILFSLLSSIINKVGELNLSYSNLLNIGVFALIPPAILETLVDLSGLKIPSFGLIYYGLYLFFLISGILSCKKPALTEKIE